MGMRVTNLSEVTVMFQMMDRTVNKESREILKKATEDIRDTARAFAPVDMHRLEKAIHILPLRGNQYMMRTTIEVSGTVGGRSVDSYAAIVHEYPWHKRGPLTRMKGPRAGPRYLVRAVDAHKAKLISDLRQTMVDAIEKSVSRSGVNVRKGRR